MPVLPPLLDLFLQLRRAGVSLGLEEYLAAVEALQAGFGLGDEAALRRLCLALWIKDEDDRRIFDRYFDAWLTVIPDDMAPKADGAAETTLKERAPERSEEPPEAQPPEPAEGEPAAADRKAADPWRDPAWPTPAELASQLTPPLTQASLVTSQPLDLKDPTHLAEVLESIVIPLDEAVDTGDRFRIGQIRYPVSTRQMKQSWRYLRRTVRDGPPVELDLAATVAQLAREGLLFQPVLRPRRTNRAELTLLVDYDGSMMPFHYLADRLVDTARRGGRLGQADVFYFRNVPGDNLFNNPSWEAVTPLEAWYRQLKPTFSAVLIFSDAGAARGRLRLPRIEATTAFLRRLKQEARYVAWLNPLPLHRWPNTSAGAIAREVPMFPTSRRGLHNAIRVLRGRLVRAPEDIVDGR